MIEGIHEFALPDSPLVRTSNYALLATSYINLTGL